MKLSTALTLITSTTSLKSGLAKNSAFLRGYDQVKGPFDVLQCTIDGKTDETACDTAVTADGDPCSFCSMSSDGEEAGLCVSPDVAAQMVEMNDSVSCTNTGLISTTGFDKEEFKCEIAAMNDAGKCAATMTVGEESCEFCTVEGPFGTQSFCFSPDHADKLKGVVGDKMSCVSNGDIKTSEEVEGPFDVLQCTFDGKTDETACATAVTADGDPCSFCSMSSDGEEAGLCVSPDVAAQMVEMNDSVSCTNTGLTGPITDCNIHGIDHDTCLDPSKVNGSKCIWCDAEIGGFCFPKDWEKPVGKFLSCEETKEIEVEVEPEDEQLKIDPSFLTSNCFTVGLKGASPDDCRASVDEKTGGNCIFCSAPKLGGIGLCMTPEFKGNEGQFYVCDDDTNLAVE